MPPVPAWSVKNKRKMNNRGIFRQCIFASLEECSPIDSNRFSPLFRESVSFSTIIYFNLTIKLSKLNSFSISTMIDMEIDLHEITSRFEKLHPREEWNWPIPCLNDSETQERDRF